MATYARTVWKGVVGCQRQLRSGGVSSFPTFPSNNVHVRAFAAVKTLKKGKKAEAAAPEVKKEKRVVNDTNRHKPFGKTAWAPVDDVYVLRHYPRTIYSAVDAVELLKSFQGLDFTPHDQPVYVDLKLDMKLEKKKKIDPFVGTLHLPHPFKTDVNKVLVFTEDANQARVAHECGAAFVGGTELIQQVTSSAFFIPLLQGSIGINIPKMLSLFRTGHEYGVESECYVRTQVATLDFPTQHILANLEIILTDVRSHRPADMGPLIERAILSSRTSEALWFNSESVLPQTAEDNQQQ
ncbi:39S ribosomal protein L1, mitochondrial-like [Hippocampus comes]|uniref:39S ribosomal protein L1, mitochondrial-like n=1 Tax=Hippocampus comes TaxID=109280 RepID=UPI00094F223C|nr:PREDICTED: 39S ribosomal protein L1, mitochondrial-like [Hippocampus comes]